MPSITKIGMSVGCSQEGEHEAVYLRDVMQYFPSERALHWTNWQLTEAGGHPGTLMAKRSAPIRYPVEGTSASIGEDLRVALHLKKRGHVCFLPGMPHLFLYVNHGSNSWDGTIECSLRSSQILKA